MVYHTESREYIRGTQVSTILCWFNAIILIAIIEMNTLLLLIRLVGLFLCITLTF